MTPDQVIVTLQIEGGSSLGDYELPTGFPAKQLAFQLLGILKQQSPELFRTWNTLHMSYHGQRLQEGDTLESKGIWDGSYLTISQK